jgi:hypothetical protein
MSSSSPVPNKQEKNVKNDQEELAGKSQQQQQQQQQPQQLYQFPLDMKIPIWDRKTVPVTEKEDPRKELERSNSKWIYGLKGEMLVVRSRDYYSSFSFLQCRTWSVHLFSGVFDIHKDWKLIESDYYPVPINDNEEDDNNIIVRGYQWLDMKLNEYATRSKQDPLWIFIEQFELQGILAYNTQYHIATECKCFLESERPMFIVRFEFYDTLSSRNDAKHNLMMENFNIHQSYFFHVKRNLMMENFNIHQSYFFDRLGFGEMNTIYENPAATICEKTCKNTKKWDPSNLEKKERKRRWVISIYDKDGLCALKDPIEQGTMEVACTLDIALQEAFDRHGEKYPRKRIGEVLTASPMYGISLIQKKRTRQNPQSGRLQLYYYMLKLDSLQLRFDNLYRDARAETRTVVDDILSRTNDDYMNSAIWYRPNKIMQVKKEIDDLLPKVRLEHQERAVKMLQGKKKPKEELWNQVLSFLKKSY